MLALLHIENIAVIESADISFASGFNVLTGETGAGKSIVIDSISAILGERVYRDVIRTGAQKAFVSAIFQDVPPLEWFENNHVPYEEETIIQRELTVDGRNTCRVNSQPVTVSVLHQLGMQLINIHGQHDTQQLFDDDNHLHYLDLFAHNEDLLEQYRTAYESLMSVQHEIDRLTIDESEKIRRTEILRHQIREIEAANLSNGEDEKLEKRRKLLHNSEKFSSGLIHALRCLYGDEDSDGASGMIAEAEYSLERISRFDSRIESLHDSVSELSCMAQEICEELIDLKDAVSFSPEELDELETRLDLIYRLRKKYGATCSDVLSFLENAKKELSEIQLSDDLLIELRKRLQKLEASANIAALNLRQNRQKFAKELEERIRTELAQLDMPKVQFVCNFEEIPLSSTGIDKVSFLMSANVGETLKSMSKVASGGELARIMLAMKNVLAEKDSVPTLIFDEVDSGVSGRAAQKVASKLLRVSSCKQVLCVTHLPQIAAMADRHLLIKKTVQNGRTYTNVSPLDRDGRINELARIIGGEVITDTTRRSAAEMLR